MLTTFLVRENTSARFSLQTSMDVLVAACDLGKALAFSCYTSEPLHWGVTHLTITALSGDRVVCMTLDCYKSFSNYEP